jgi:hypothetical protein
MTESCRIKSCRISGRLMFAFMPDRNWAWVLVAASLLAGSALAEVTASSKAESERLVAAAAKAEMGGETSRAFSLLHDAVRIDPENRLARWQLGEVKVDGQWMTAEELQRRSAADPRQVEYRERRKEAGQTPQGQMALARWCRKNNLNDEAQFHWVNVLAVDPKNGEALHALDLRWQKGRLVSCAQTAQQKEQSKEAKRAAERWNSKIVKWRRAVSGQDLAARGAALDEIRNIKPLDAIPSLEEVTLGRDAHDPVHADECLEIGLAFIEALSKQPPQQATESLARHAVFSPGKQAQTSATEKLKTREKHDYIPMLLGGLGMPFESSYSVMTGPDGSVHYLHSLYREGADADWSFDSRRAAVQKDLGGRKYTYDVKSNTMEVGPPTGNFPSEIAKKTRVTSQYNSRYATAAATTEATVARTNYNIETINSLIVPVLRATTGKDFGDNPKAWWEWWRGENDYYASGDHPVDRYYYWGTDNTYTYGFPAYEVRYPVPPPGPRGPFSCFVKGTPIWTKTGVRPIETLELGDLVLSQDVNSGELKYQPVIVRTVRPRSPIVKISFSNEDILATKGHPFWVIGAGWRMAKEVGNGDVLHGVSGSSAIRKVEAAGEAETYNLIVAGFNTYFVGESGILVHDNTPRTPTQTIMPGILANK